jgi:hypothetical protein
LLTAGEILARALGFDDADTATALRAHVVRRLEAIGPVQAERDHRGGRNRHLKSRGQALGADVGRMLLEEFDHDFAKR